MTREVEIVDPDTTLQNTARIMAEIHAGILPVSDGERLIGMITDRDIAVRGVALGRSPDTRVGDVMSQEVLYCFEDQDVEAIGRAHGWTPGTNSHPGCRTSLGKKQRN